MDNNKPIDIVITWVDGNDPEHRRRRGNWSECQIRHEDIDGDTRFASVGEIAYCIASINRFAPFIRKIFIITDHQNPGINPENEGRVTSPDSPWPLSSFLAEHFERPIPMEIVDHTTIFKGYETYLPTFNCNSIETMFWQVPGLSERFIYFNDDVILIKETTPETFFEGDKAVAYGYWHPKWTAALLRTLRPKKQGHKEATFRDFMLNASDLVGTERNFFHLVHTPHPLLKSVLTEYFSTHPEAVIRNIKDKFRSPVQFNPQTVFQELAIPAGKAVIRSADGLTFYLKPKADPAYMAGSISRCEAMPDAVFLCMNSLDQAAEKDRDLLLRWLAGRLRLNRTYKDRTMNIAIIHDGFPGGGAERISADIAEYLAGFPGNHYKVFVYCKHWKKEKMTARMHETMTIRTCLHSLLGRYRDVLNYIRKDKIDIILQSSNYLHGIRSIQKKTGVRVIFANHGKPFWQQYTLTVNMARRHPFLWKHWLEKRYIEKGEAYRKAVKKTRKWYDRCDIYTVLCEAYKTETAAGLGIDLEKSHIRAIENSEKPVKEICWKKEKIILYSGRIVYDIKRIDRLLRIWKRIQHELPDWKMMFVGDGPGMKMCRNIVATEQLERVSFEGFHTDLTPYYRKASIVCLTSESEGWPLSMTEAQAHGCIPVAFDCCSGIREVISEDRSCGFLVPPFDEEAYARTLLQIIRMPEEQQMNVRKAAVLRRLEYTPDVIYRKWKDLFDELY